MWKDSKIARPFMAREVDMYSRIKNRTDNDSYRMKRPWKNRTDEWRAGMRAGMNGEQE